MGFDLGGAFNAVADAAAPIVETALTLGAIGAVASAVRPATDPNAPRR